MVGVVSNCTSGREALPEGGREAWGLTKTKSVWCGMIQGSTGEVLQRKRKAREKNTKEREKQRMKKREREKRGGGNRVAAGRGWKAGYTGHLGMVISRHFYSTK